MYLWKCWRDTRVTVFVSFVVILCLFVPIVAGFNGHRLQKLWEMMGLMQISLVITRGFMPVVCWILGKESVGADIGNGYGDFLLARPISPRRLVWTGWTVGMAECVSLWILLSAILYAAILLKLHLLGIPVPKGPATPPEIPLLFAIVLLNLGLVYGFTYCIGIIGRSGSRALIATAVVAFGYVLLKGIFRLQLHIQFPDFLLTVNTHHNQLVVPSTLAFAVHVCLLVAFPVVAHFVLERMEI